MKPSDIFKCKKCGDCCKGYGGTFVTGQDIKAIADYIHADPELFVDNYCRMSGNRPVLKQAENGYCIFWEKQCTIHPVKPRMCKLWPFIENVLADVDNWQIMASSCPGIRTDVPDNIIKKCVAEVLESYSHDQNASL